MSADKVTLKELIDIFEHNIIQYARGHKKDGKHTTHTYRSSRDVALVKVLRKIEATLTKEDEK